jgi:hypothetical protein
MDNEKAEPEQKPLEDRKGAELINKRLVGYGGSGDRRRRRVELFGDEGKYTERLY